MNNLRVLIADDDTEILFAFSQLCMNDHHTPITATDGEKALDLISRQKPDIAFFDLTMPKISGMELLKKIRSIDAELPIVLFTGYGNMQSAIEASQLGALEYLTKPIDIAKIREILKRIYSTKKNKSKSSNTLFTATISEEFELIGRSSKMLEVYKMIGSVSLTPNNVPVLITGESGTGKELVARAIHNSGKYRTEPFIAINCTAIPDNLLESELFGFEKGAFTGADETKKGKFEISGKGTIFLDEIGSLSESVQKKLLRVLQNREFERLGGLKQHSIEARFIAATNANLKDEIKKGRFRSDLYYRLNVAHIELPALRDRKEDIKPLIAHFISRYNHRLKKNIQDVDEEIYTLLENYNFPGNVRELENLIERAIILCRDDTLTISAFENPVSGHIPNEVPANLSNLSYSEAKELWSAPFEKAYIISLLKKYSGNVTKASEFAGMTRQNFSRIMRTHSISADQFRTN